MNQNNGNAQLNEAHEGINTRINRLANIGRSKSVIWQSKRRFRTI